MRCCKVKWLKRDAVKGGDVDTQIDYLRAAGCQHFVYELKQVLSVTAKSFDEYYQPIIDAVANLLQQLPDRYHAEHNQPYGLLQGTCARTITALKLRRHRFLPVGGDAETGYAQADYWTYAVFVCAITRDLWKSLEFELLVSSQRFEPLTETNHLPHTDFVAKTYRLNTHSNMALILACLHKDATKFLQHIPLVWEQVVLYWHHETCSITPLIAAEEGILRPEVLPAEPSFTEQLNAALAVGEITCNEDNSAVHAVAEGLLLVMPEFLTAWKATSKTTLDEAQLTSKLKEEKILVRNQPNSNWHTYYQGHGFKKVVLEGFLLDKTKITTPININDTLYRET